MDKKKVDNKMVKTFSQELRDFERDREEYVRKKLPKQKTIAEQLEEWFG